MPWGTSTRVYTPEEKAAAVAMVEAEGGNATRAAKKLGIPYGTLKDWMNGKNMGHGAARLIPMARRELADVLEDKAHQLTEGLDEQKIAKAGLQATAVSLGIVVDKMQLLRGKPTNITDMSDDEKRIRLLELVEKGRMRLGAAPELAEDDSVTAPG